jgi:hypothetical protein
MDSKGCITTTFSADTSVQGTSRDAAMAVMEGGTFQSHVPDLFQLSTASGFIVKWKVASHQNEANDPKSPHIHRLACSHIRTSTHSPKKHDRRTSTEKNTDDHRYIMYIHQHMKNMQTDTYRTVSMRAPLGRRNSDCPPCLSTRARPQQPLPLGRSQQS